MLVVVETVDIGVVPHLASTQRGMSVALESDAVYLVFRKDDAFGAASFDANLREVLVEENLLEFGSRVKRHFNHLRLTIWIGSEIDHL